MPIVLYDATIASFLQGLGAVDRLLDKAEAFCGENDFAPADLIQARLAPDMLPFAYQVKSVAVHSARAIEGVRHGVFSPDMTPSPDSFDGLRVVLTDARTLLEAVRPDELEDLIGRDMRFEMGDLVMPFTAENFLLSFSVPNFYFHATTCYALMRAAGVAIGKRDYLGRPRLKM